MEEFAIPGVKAALKRLHERKAQAFGSEGHGFQMNPVLSESEAAAFEREHKIVLPSGYRQFITELGNGGAGPFYGVFPLGWMDHDFNKGPWHENDGFVGSLSKPFPLRVDWERSLRLPRGQSDRAR